MEELAKKVKLLEPIDLDAITIKKDHYFPRAYIIDLPLESAPNHVWQDLFDREWKSSRHLWDRKLYIIGEKLRLVTTASDVEDKLDWVKQVVEKTNNSIEEYNKEMEGYNVQTEEMIKRQIPDEDVSNIELIRTLVRKRFQIV